MYSAYYGQSQVKFEDWTFPADENALYWPKPGQDIEGFKTIKAWKRPSELSGGKKPKLFGKGST